jgi:hypothetical protein
MVIDVNELRKNLRVVRAPNDKKENRYGINLIGPRIEDDYKKNVYLLVTPSKIIGMKFL